MANIERSHWRDEAISTWHRTLGPDFPCVDLDCIVTAGGDVVGQGGWTVAEYDLREPKALIEYKAVGKRYDASDANNVALCRLADNSKVPFCIVHNAPDMSYFIVHPINEIARAIMVETEFDETGYKAWLLEIRKTKKNSLTAA